MWEFKTCKRFENLRCLVLMVPAMFSLPLATEADFPAIRELIYVANINPTGLDWRRIVLAVTPEGTIIGCGQVKPHRDGSQELASIAVLPERRRQGVAKAIITLLLTIYIHYIRASHFMPHPPRSMSINCRMAM
jgi:GNAT superfamily N-acetyltransferase